MPEVRRSPERSPLEITLKAVEEGALRLRKTYSDDAACVRAAMRGHINDADPQRNEYFREIIRRLKRKGREFTPPRQVARDQVIRSLQNPLSNRPVPETTLSPEESAALIARAKEALREHAWEQTLAQAAENEKLHPEDAYRNDLDT